MRIMFVCVFIVYKVAQIPHVTDQYLISWQFGILIEERSLFLCYNELTPNYTSCVIKGGDTWVVAELSI